MSSDPDVSAHYTSGNLMDRLRAELLDDGTDPGHPAIDGLIPYDQFHGRGIEATKEIADSLNVEPSHHLLDVGSGIGGPARYFADRFGCQVTGIDLTAEFCEAAAALTNSMKLAGKVKFELGDALSMPFAAATFDGAYSMNVSMNIEDKAGLYREIYRVLKPGGWLVLSEIAQGPGGQIEYPTPWARTSASSFLASPEETRAGLEASGFTISSMRDTLEENRDYGARAKEIADRGEKPPHRSVKLIHGDIAGAAMSNTAAGQKNGLILPIEIVCEKPH